MRNISDAVLQADEALLTKLVQELPVRDLISLIRLTTEEARDRVLGCLSEKAAKDALGKSGQTMAINIKRMDELAGQLLGEN